MLCFRKVALVVASFVLAFFASSDARLHLRLTSALAVGDCPGDLIRNPQGRCVCPGIQIQVGTRCQCPSGMIKKGRICDFPPRKPRCPDEMEYVSPYGCLRECDPDWETRRGRLCVPVDRRIPDPAICWLVGNTWVTAPNEPPICKPRGPCALGHYQCLYWHPDSEKNGWRACCRSTQSCWSGAIGKGGVRLDGPWGCDATPLK